MSSGHFKNIKLSTFSIFVSILVLALFNHPFFSHAVQHISGGANGAIIVSSLALLMFAINFLVTYIVLFLFRTVGKAIIAISFIINAICLYFINTYDVLLDDTMMGNVFNTNYSEATGYYSPAAILYILGSGIAPSVLLFAIRVNYGRFKRFLACIGISLAAMVAIGFGNITNWPWVDKNSTELGSLILPWSYTVNTFRYKAAERENNREETLLPDATILNGDKEAVVLVIGESARRDHFSLYGYGRQTNPLLSQVEGLKAYKANSAATYTTAGVKAILDSQDSDKLYETLPNYLHRSGAEVIWRTSNWGQPPLHIEKYYETYDLLKQYPEANPDYDGILFEGIDSVITSSGKPKVLIVLHTSISHGPSYEKRYPQQFKVFSPVNHSVEMSAAVQSELFNSYDNSIVYTDYLLARTVSDLKALSPEWKTCMIYISDHGESLGENNLYMHGVPMAIAPREQYEIPFLIWTSDDSIRYKDIETAGQHHIFHSVLHFLSIDSPAYKEELNIFE